MLLLEKLDEHYGNTEWLVKTYRDELENQKNIKNRDHECLREFASMLTQMVEVSRSSDQFTFLNETSLIKLLCDKLPERLASSWVECLGKYKDNHGGKYPNFEEFANFVNTRSRYQNDPYFAGG